MYVLVLGALLVATQAVSAMQDVCTEVCVFINDHNLAINSVCVGLALICLPIFLSNLMGRKKEHEARGTTVRKISLETGDMNVGILATEVYFPPTFVKQSELERANGVSQGKYTIGLGQKGMAFTGDREDVNSMALSVVSQLMEKYKVTPEEIGRVEVGTETLVDKSKSTKTILMDLFTPCGNTEIEGATIINACYGGTAALLNAVSWCESPSWDGRYALVVASDIAVYEAGPARPSGGCGAVALLIGRDAPLVLDSRLKATHSENTWDFYKPHTDSEYPVVDGILSQKCYLQSLETTYTAFIRKCTAHLSSDFSAKDVDYWLFHSPYHKLVRKAFSRLLFVDCTTLGHANQETLDELYEWRTKNIEETYGDKGLEAALAKLTASSFEQKVLPGCELSRQLGNTYTAAIFCNLASLIDSCGESLVGKRIGLFSYGSGSIASMYTLEGARPTDPRFTIERMQEVLDLSKRLADRVEVPPVDLGAALRTRVHLLRRLSSQDSESIRFGFPIERLAPGTYFLKSIDDKGIRRYECRESSSEFNPTAPILIPDVQPATKEAPQPVIPPQPISSSPEAIQPTLFVTGVSAGLPTCHGSNRPMFDSGNLQRLLEGENCISRLTSKQMDSMIDKNVVQLKKMPDGSTMRVVQATHNDCVKLAAQVRPVDLTLYGVDPRLAATMDSAAQGAVAAGLEALKDARLVQGEPQNASSWKLPEHLKDTTGVIYASSFPGLDAAMTEAMRYATSKSTSGCSVGSLVRALKRRLQYADGGRLSAEDTQAFATLEATASLAKENNPNLYEFDRKFLFKVLVLGNAQLAQVVGARGPNVQTNSACSGTTQAMAMAQDMIAQGRCERVVVIGGDNASSDVLLPWLANGFRALGAASMASKVEGAALPFDCRRNGMLLGAGAVGLVLESESSFRRRAAEYDALSQPVLGDPRIKCRLLAAQYSNSAYHGAALDKKHIASELNRFLDSIETKFGLTRAHLASNAVYLSHETCTHSSPASSCAANEVGALREAFGEHLAKLILVNTKGFTGHPMGVSFEDVAAVEIIFHKHVPPTANTQQPDPYLGEVNVSRGGPFAGKYALRFAAGFGSHVAFTLYGSVN